MPFKLVIVESPFASNSSAEHARNVTYARECLHDSLLRGEAPFASHLLYPQVLEDKVKGERELGIEAGLAWGQVADLTAVYTDLGISEGMRQGIAQAEASGRKVETRRLKHWRQERAA